MLDQLINLSKVHLSQTIIAKTNLSEDQVGSALDEVKGTLLSGLIDMVLSGNISPLIDLFNGKEVDTSALQYNINQKLIPILSEKLGISYEQAEGISDMIIVFILNKFTSKETGTVSDGNELLNKLGIDSGSIFRGIGSTIGGMFSSN